MNTNIIMHLILIACGIITFGMMSSCDADRTIIRNEEDLIGTCTKKCEDIPELFSVDKCTRVSGCKKNSEGWTKGFVKCNYCACNCKEDLDASDVVIEKKPLSTREKDLYGTCHGSCNKHGLVRTDFKKCQEVRDCKKAGKGPLSGVHHNDFCTCTCINRKYANSYELTNIKYDINGAEVYDGKPDALESVNLINKDPNMSNTATHSVAIKYVQTKTMDTSKSVQLGLTVSVKTGINIEIVSVEENLQFSYNAGYTYTAGSSESVAHEYTVTATSIVPPASKTNAMISGTVMKIDVPYTATLVTTYEDGSTSEKPIEGIYTDVETAMFTVTYEAPVPIIDVTNQHSEL